MLLNKELTKKIIYDIISAIFHRKEYKHNG
jgi:hypothetical protein